MSTAKPRRKSSPRQKTFWAVALSAFVGVLVLGVAYFSSVSLIGAAWIITGALLTISIAAIAILAGFVVVKSLFLIAAELSLLIFLAQSYCAAPTYTHTSDTALRSLILLGVIYVAFAFAQSLYTAIRERYIQANVNEWTIRKIVLTALFLTFTVIFLGQVYLVMQPIIGGLCVYSR